MRSPDAPRIVGDESGLATVLAAVERAACTDVNVLVRGETGSGKEVVARALHQRSERRGRPFVVADCAVIPDELMESAFFGHVRGAFTGAIADHVGYFESAGAGTLLLDEVGDLDLHLQAKILRVVEERTFRRVGSSQVLANRARLVAATNQPLERLIETRRFRQDLYFRLDVFTIDVPPLRERRVDIPEFVRHFLEEGHHRHGLALPAFTREAMEMLVAHDWPGNVRELRNVVQRLLLTQEPVIGSSLVQSCMRTRALPEVTQRVRPLRDVEREAILHALEVFGGNRTQAAVALGIGRRTLQMKLRAYGILDERSGSA